jgi:hypothetical protein
LATGRSANRRFHLSQALNASREPCSIRRRGIGHPVCPADPATRQPSSLIPAHAPLDYTSSRSTDPRLAAYNVSHPAHHPALCTHQDLLAA